MIKFIYSMSIRGTVSAYMNYNGLNNYNEYI